MKSSSQHKNSIVTITWIYLGGPLLSHPEFLLYLRLSLFWILYLSFPGFPSSCSLITFQSVSCYSLVVVFSFSCFGLLKKDVTAFLCFGTYFFLQVILLRFSQPFMYSYNSPIVTAYYYSTVWIYYHSSIFLLLTNGLFPDFATTNNAAVNIPVYVSWWTWARFFGYISRRYLLEHRAWMFT